MSNITTLTPQSTLDLRKVATGALATMEGDNERKEPR